MKNGLAKIIIVLKSHVHLFIHFNLICDPFITIDNH